MWRTLGVLGICLSTALVAGAPSRSHGLQARWVNQVVVVSGEVERGGWAPALLMPGKVLVIETSTPGGGKLRGAPPTIPGATVEVTEALMEDPRTRIYTFASSLNPSLQRAYRIGESNSVGSQILSEFMGMNPDYTHPPSIPPVFYNCLVPEALRNGLTVNPGGKGWIQIQASPRVPQHVELYPRR